MARIKQESVEAVKAAADMLDVVGGRTQLRKAGARYVGRCPFHEERTPSFSVNPVDKLFYCFGCGKGGDLISFVRETENVDFAGADRVARRPLPRAARVRRDVAGGGRGAETARAAVRGARAGDVVLRALPVGDRAGRTGSRVSRGARLERGDLPRVPARPLADGARRSRARLPRKDSPGPSWLLPGSPTGAATTTSRGG